MRLRNLFEAEGKVAAFALGRLNPATTGHELLVNAIKEQPGDHFLFLTDRAPKLPDNPLTSEEKLDWARKSFPDINVELAQGISVAAHKLYQMGYRKITFLEGEDKLYKILVNYNGKTEGKKGPIEFPYKFDKIDYVQLTRDADADDATGMSGTKLRGYVANNDLKGFKSGVTDPAKPYAEQMFKKLQGIMGVDTVEESNVVLDKTSLRQYIRDMIMDHINSEDDIKKLSTILYNLVGKEVKHRGQRYVVTDEDVNEIMSFGIRTTPKRATIKKKPEKFEKGVQDKIKIRRQAFAKGDKNAFSKDWEPKGGW